jgi:hypothetical protein
MSKKRRSAVSVEEEFSAFPRLPPTNLVDSYRASVEMLKSFDIDEKNLEKGLLKKFKADHEKDLHAFNQTKQYFSDIIGNKSQQMRESANKISKLRREIKSDDNAEELFKNIFKVHLLEDLRSKSKDELTSLKLCCNHLSLAIEHVEMFGHHINTSHSIDEIIHNAFNVFSSTSSLEGSSLDFVRQSSDESAESAESAESEDPPSPIPLTSSSSSSSSSWFNLGF